MAGNLTAGQKASLNKLTSACKAAGLGDFVDGTAKTMTLTKSDGLSVGGNIISQHQTLVNQNIPLHASKVIYNLYTAPSAFQVTEIYFTVDIPQGGALTATLVKATGTATPASATTPLHIAAAINLNGTAHTVQTITLTVTLADTQLAAGDRIGLVLSGAMTVGSGLVTVRGKRI